MAQTPAVLQGALGSGGWAGRAQSFEIGVLGLRFGVRLKGPTAPRLPWSYRPSV